MNLDIQEKIEELQESFSQCYISYPYIRDAGHDIPQITLLHIDLIERELRSIKTSQDLFNKIKHYNQMKEQLISGK
jgi:hypothetical protein